MPERCQYGGAQQPAAGQEFIWTRACSLIGNTTGFPTIVPNTQCANCSGDLSADGFALATIEDILERAITRGILTQAQAEARATAAGISLD